MTVIPVVFFNLVIAAWIWSHIPIASYSSAAGFNLNKIKVKIFFFTPYINTKRLPFYLPRICTANMSRKWPLKRIWKYEKYVYIILQIRLLIPCLVSNDFYKNKVKYKLYLHRKQKVMQRPQRYSLCFSCQQVASDWTLFVFHIYMYICYQSIYAIRILHVFHNSRWSLSECLSFSP